MFGSDPWEMFMHRIPNLQKLNIVIIMQNKWKKHECKGLFRYENKITYTYLLKYGYDHTYEIWGREVWSASVGLAKNPNYQTVIDWFKGQNKYNIIHPKPDGKTYLTLIKNIMKIRKIETKKFKTSWKNKDEFWKCVKSGT